MHICFVIGEMNFSGAEKVLSIIAKELSVLGNTISIVLLKDGYGIVRKLEYFTTYGAYRKGNRFVRILKRWIGIRKIVSSISPDIVVSFGSVCNVNTIAAMFFKRIPLIVCERNDPQFDPRTFFDKFTRWFLYRWADGFVFQTERIKKYFSKDIQNKAVVIPNPIIDSGLRWQRHSSKKSIVSVARLDDFQKDQIVMIEAFSKFLKTNSQYTLDIFGDGPDRELLENKIAELGLQKNIILHGKTSDPLKEVVNAEIFLLTSKFEGMPNALMEALSIGIPCVVTDCGGGGAYELCSMVNAGIVVPVGDIESISEALCSLTNDKDREYTFSDNSVSINSILSKENVSMMWINFLQTKLTR